MIDVLALSLAAVLSWAGQAWLALSLTAHWRQVWGETAAFTPAGRLGLRWLGTLSLLLSALCCGLADRPSIALLVWIMLQAGSTVSIAMLLAWRARSLRRLSRHAKTPSMP